MRVLRELLLLLCAAPALPLHAEFPAAAVRPAVCEVLVDGHVACSGFFVDSRGLCLTCAHGVVAGKSLEVLLADGRRLRAALEGLDVGADTAAVRVEAIGAGGTPCLAFAPEAPPLGAPLKLAGTALYRRGLMLGGTVARTDPAFEYNPDLKTYVEVFYVDAMTAQGTSGGPWLDAEGRVVGLQSGGISLNGAFCGVAFVVPARLLRPLAEKPREAPARGDLGAACDELWEHPPATIRRFAAEATEGLLLCRLLKDGACDRAGLANGELLVSCEGRPCRFREDFIRAVRARPPGRPLQVEVLREKSGALVRERATILLDGVREAPFLQLE